MNVAFDQCPPGKKPLEFFELSGISAALINNFAIATMEVSLFSMQRFKRNFSGFTLLELLVVMVIIGLLAGYVGPRYFAQVGKSEIKAARAQMDALKKSLDQYRLDTGHYPSSELGLNALNIRPGSEAKWDGPYLEKKAPPDPWGQPYVYRQPGEHGEYDLLSYGKDGQPGGSGEAADITNW